MIELYPYLLVFLGGSSIVLAIAIVVLVRRHAKEANLWAKDRKTTGGLLRQSDERISTLLKLTESFPMLISLAARTGHLEDEEMDMSAEGGLYSEVTKATAYTTTMWGAIPEVLIRYLPNTKALIETLQPEIDPESLELEREANDPDYFD